MTVTVDGNVIKLYGTIWWGDGAYIQNQIEPVLRQYSEVTIRLHTPGGSVVDGNLIYNSIKNSKAKITTIIDGLCASMGTILMLSGDTIKMAENAFVMIHAPFGWVEGTAKDLKNYAKLLENTEKNFIKKYAAKTGRKESELAAWMLGDNWFDADEAKAEGLVDEILDTEIDGLEIDASGKFQMAACASMFKEYDNQPRAAAPPATPVASTDANNLNTDSMKLNAKNLTALGLEADASEKQINAAVAKLQQRAEDAEAKATTAEDKATALQEKIDAQNEAKVTALVDRAVKEGRITADKKDQYKQLAEANYELAEKTINDLPVKGSLVDEAKEQGKTGASAADRSDWNFDKWRKEDPKGLIEMKANDRDAYDALLAK